MMFRLRNIPINVLGVSLIAWFLMFSFFQYIDPLITVSRCGYPHNPKSDLGFPVEIDKILIVADPQLIDNHTYPSYPKAVLSLARLTVHNYLYKSYSALLTILRPHTVIFVGDLLDNGRESADDHYENEFNLFKRIFLNPVKNKDIEIITNVPGNHDIGWANGVTKDSLDRFDRHFGKSNLVLQRANHNLILFDDLSMANTEDPAVYGPSHKFLDEIKDTKLRKTRILFTHVPMWRDVTKQTCGPRREASTFPISKGYQYQTVIDPPGTERILQSFQPDIIFSGDDHDYCEVVLEYQNLKGETKTAININVKSLSMAMNIKKPAAHLLTLYHEPVMAKDDVYIGEKLVKRKGEHIDYSFDICYTSRTYVEIIFYILLAVINFFWLVFNNVKTNANNYHNLGTEKIYLQRIKAHLTRIHIMKLTKLIIVNSVLVLILFCILTFV